MRISIPQALPGIVAAALVAFATSMDEFILTSLVTGSDTTLPLYIFGQLRFSVTPEIVALSTMLLVTSALLLVIGCVIGFIGRRKDGAAGAADMLSLAPTA